MKTILALLTFIASLLLPGQAMPKESLDEIAINGLWSVCANLKKQNNELKKDIEAALLELRRDPDYRLIELENVRNFKVSQIEKDLEECEKKLASIPEDETEARACRQEVVETLKQVLEEYLLSWRMVEEIKASMSKYSFKR